MEHLLSTSFDLLSSYDPVHIRKGLRCLEGFLAKMCLSAPPPRPKDAAFKEFMRLQSGFEYNGMTFFFFGAGVKTGRGVLIWRVGSDDTAYFVFGAVAGTE